MVSKEEAEATFRALVNNTDATVSSAVAAATSSGGGRNYKLIIAIVLVVLVLLGIGGWWWFRGRKGKSAPAATPAIGRGVSTRVSASTAGAPGSK